MELATRRPDESKTEIEAIVRLTRIREACARLSCRHMDLPQCPLAFPRDTASEVALVASGCLSANQKIRQSMVDSEK